MHKKISIITKIVLIVINYGILGKIVLYLINNWTDLSNDKIKSEEKDKIEDMTTIKILINFIYSWK